MYMGDWRLNLTFETFTTVSDTRKIKVTDKVSDQAFKMQIEKIFAGSWLCYDLP